MRAIVASEPIIVSFDSSTAGHSDTITANRLQRSPLLDGIDGGKEEWGPQETFLRLRPVPTGIDGDTVRDPHIYRALCRAAYDDQYFYLLISWREVTILGHADDGQQVAIVTAGDNIEDNRLYLDVSHPDTVVRFTNGRREIDTLFSNLRVRRIIHVDSVCFPPPPLPPVICDVTYDTTYDTVLIWKSDSASEDKVAIYWSPESTEALSELPKTAYEMGAMTVGPLAGEKFIDIWRWGAATTQPVTIADDWNCSGGQYSPDIGNSPFEINWILPDSIPRFMRRLDPNHSICCSEGITSSPLWYYDVIPYNRDGWSRRVIVYVSNIVTMIPSASRADVSVFGRFFDSEWTVEFKRARRTGNADDIEF